MLCVSSDSFTLSYFFSSFPKKIVVNFSLKFFCDVPDKINHKILQNTAGGVNVESIKMRRLETVSLTNVVACFNLEGASYTSARD